VQKHRHGNIGLPDQKLLSLIREQEKISVSPAWDQAARVYEIPIHIAEISAALRAEGAAARRSRWNTLQA